MKNLQRQVKQKPERRRINPMLRQYIAPRGLYATAGEFPITGLVIEPLAYVPASRVMLLLPWRLPRPWEDPWFLRATHAIIECVTWQVRRSPGYADLSSRALAPGQWTSMRERVILREGSR